MSYLSITINGKEQKVNDGTTINDILDKLNITNKMLVVEKNTEIIQKDQYNLPINNNDNIEIVMFCGGG